MSLLPAELVARGRALKEQSIRSLFESDESRASNMSVTSGQLFLDYSKQHIDSQCLTDLVSWAGSCGIVDKTQHMFTGSKINNTEQRAVLHSVLRAPESKITEVLGEQAVEVIATEAKMYDFVDSVLSGKNLSVNNKKFTDVIAIGIGGSYYGIKVGLSALASYNKGINVHVLANIDGNAIEQKLAMLNPDTTLVVVISKTFTTQETLLNANAVKNWAISNSSHNNIIENNWLAVSTNIASVTEFGIASGNIFPMWDWVGGRFSVWSAVGLPLALAIGSENFKAFKQGAYEMDTHFSEAPLENNMPVIMALLGIWNRNVFDYPILTILPYDHSLRALPGYLQQTDMESNGKSVSNDGEPLSWLTAPTVFGQEGTNSQHAFMQLMHQSTEILPTDFIVCAKGNSNYEAHHQAMLANCFAQSEALMQGKTLEQAEQELLLNGVADDEAKALAKHKTMKGNTPSNTLLIDELTPESFGSLIALYEHKIFIQGALWQLNSFDQWGVELGKTLGKDILAAMSGETSEHLSASTYQLIQQCKK